MAASLNHPLAGRLRCLATCSVLLVALLAAGESRGDDPLPSWNDGPAKQAILDFVAKVTKVGGPDFVLPADRIATFDNDGTLWVEQPMYTQIVFAFDRIKAAAPDHPEWKTTEPFAAALANDYKAVFAEGEKSGVKLLMIGHAGMTPDAFEQIVVDWLATAKHPRFDRPYTQLVYQPMVEVLEFLRANEFKTFIVSGGGIDFMRPWTEKAYGIPRDQVVGSCIEVKFELIDGQPTLMRLPAANFVDDGPGKPVGIQRFIGQRPILAFGNSDGDFEMLQWTTAGDGPRLGLIVHHTDGVREYAYDRDSMVGQLKRGLDAAKQEGWILVSMKDDWKKIFSFEED
ncbi:HAD family hydrolase [Lacipirellula sp.]|uniref:HAD family hydrolase n=1 Tax=Lacipirellula sp. TaxID=2691419 RepID=UPI003D0F3C2B